jgi:molybdopterin/thiamine biosynthesis adenylyltransferase
MKSDILSNREVRIFKNQINLLSVGLEGQEKIKKSKVLIVGAGGKGACTLQNLSAAGVGYLGICDNHIVEEVAIPRQSLYGHGDLGKQKAIISKQRLLENNHISKFKIHNIYLAENNINSITSTYDIIVDATDNYITHLIIDDAAQKMKKPVVFGSLNNPCGTIGVFNFNCGPSFRLCYPSNPGYQSNNPLFSVIPGEGFLYSFIGSIMASEVLKIILSIPSILNKKLLKFDLLNYQFTLDSIS